MKKSVFVAFKTLSERVNEPSIVSDIVDDIIVHMEKIDQKAKEYEQYLKVFDELFELNS